MHLIDHLKNSQLYVYLSLLNYTYRELNEKSKKTV
jgi:hypothetical protein